jgi:hypothetical protein
MDASPTNIKSLLDRRGARHVFDMREIAGVVTTVGRYVVEWTPQDDRLCGR